MLLRSSHHSVQLLFAATACNFLLSFVDSSDTWRSCAFPKTAPGTNRRPPSTLLTYIRIWLYAADIDDISFSTALTPSRTPHCASAAQQHGMTSLPRLSFTSIVIQLRLIPLDSVCWEDHSPSSKARPLRGSLDFWTGEVGRCRAHAALPCAHTAPLPLGYHVMQLCFKVQRYPNEGLASIAHYAEVGGGLLTPCADGGRGVWQHFNQET